MSCGLIETLVFLVPYCSVTNNRTEHHDSVMHIVKMDKDSSSYLLFVMTIQCDEQLELCYEILTENINSNDFGHMYYYSNTVLSIHPGG